MDKGYLIISVYDNNIDKPINGATVIVTGDNYEQSFITDNNGKTPTIELDAPLKIYSLTPQKKVRPYSIYQLEVTMPGYETTIINGVQVFPEETSLQNVFLTPSNNNQQNQIGTIPVFAEDKNEPANVIDIPPHSLWDNTQDTTSEKDVSEANNSRIYPNVLIPEYVIVHNGAPSNTGVANYYVPFTDYIKNVASGEIYSTWPIESIKANIYAIISFTLNRIFTEWYKSQGYNFTITSLPRYDHTYVHNRTIFKSISDSVDQIFNSYIEIPGRNYPFLAQYNDGIDVNNPGWLSQWGSKSLADQGYTALEILKYYYVNNLTLQGANNIEGLPISFPGYNLSMGSCGEPVQKIQIMINTISGSYPKIPRIIPANGQYKANTKISIETFQEVFKLPITGIVDFATWYRISYIFAAVSRMLQGI